MWPLLLDMTKEESIQCLRNLELEAYAHLVSALRAQGPLDADKRQLLKDSSQVLNIPQDRHKAEVRRAVNDEKLNTIAYHVTGLTESIDDWAQEGRRTVPLLPRMAPQTAFSAIADEAAENAVHTNKQLPSPVCTERKRPPPQVQMAAPMCENKGAAFRIPETPKNDEAMKKRKLSGVETSTLAQHLLGPSKMNRSPQIYRQRTKGALLTKDGPKMKPSITKIPSYQTSSTAGHMQSSNGPKINIVQNITLSGPNVTTTTPTNEETIEQIQNEINSYTIQKSHATEPNENQRPLAKFTPKQMFKTAVGGATDKPLKICQPAKKQLQSTTSTTTQQLAQKLIVVSNAQTIQSSNSILQKTLSIPLVKNISVKNLEKFKIVTSSCCSSPQLVTTMSNNLNSFKQHKVVTVKAAATANASGGGAKKVIPLSILNSKGAIKVLPIGGKIVGKTTTTAGAAAATCSSPLYIVNAVKEGATHSVAEVAPSPSKENGKSSVLGDILKASGVTNDEIDEDESMIDDDFDSQSLEEFRIPNNNHHMVDDDDEDVVISDTEQQQPSTSNQDLIIVQETDKEMDMMSEKIVDETTERFLVQSNDSGAAATTVDSNSMATTEVATVAN